MSTITAYGWELHFVGGRSDKFYRVLVVESTAIIHHGRRDTAGQFRVHTYGSQREALRKARDKSNEKDDKGYYVTRELTPFEVDENDARNLQAGRPPLDRISRAFKAAAYSQGTELAGASA